MAERLDLHYARALRGPQALGDDGCSDLDQQPLQPLKVGLGPRVAVGMQGQTNTTRLAFDVPAWEFGLSH